MYLRVPMPAVSVIIPVFNVEPYVARCARSLFNQTLEDIEYIFVDDCTPDRSIEIVKEVLADYPNRQEQVHFVRTPRNGGLARARVFGLKYAKGDYIIHCDSDDAVTPDAYRLMYEKAVAEDLDIVTCDFMFFGMKKPHVQSQYSAPGKEIADILTGRGLPYVWSRLSRRNLWDNIIEPRGDMWEDMAFTIQVLSKSKRIGYVPKPLYMYYRRLGSISMSPGKLNAIRQWSSQVANVELIIKLLSGVRPVAWTAADVIILKYRCRSTLKSFVQIPQYFRRWQNTFPELDWAILWTRGVDLQVKYEYCLIQLHLYYFWNTFYLTIRRFLRKIYYRVFLNCTPPVC